MSVGRLHRTTRADSVPLGNWSDWVRRLSGDHGIEPEHHRNRKHRTEDGRRVQDLTNGKGIMIAMHTHAHALVACVPHEVLVGVNLGGFSQQGARVAHIGHSILEGGELPLEHGYCPVNGMLKMRCKPACTTLVRGHSHGPGQAGAVDASYGASSHTCRECGYGYLAPQ